MTAYYFDSSGLIKRYVTETGSGWVNIIRQHPEMATQREQILETVSTPDMIQAGDFGELLGIRFYRQTPLTEKYLVVAYRETAVDDGYILTAYLASGHE